MKGDNPYALKVDGGNFSGIRSVQDMKKSQTMLQGMEMLGYDAVNIGDRELYQGLAKFKKMLEESKLDFISCNLYEKSTGKPLADRYIIKEINGLKVGITGFVDDVKTMAPDYRGDLDLIEVKDPIESVKEVVEKLREDADLVVVLSRLQTPQSKELAREVEGIDILVVSQSTGPSKELYEENGVIMIQPGRRGQYLGAVTMDITADRTIGSYEGGAYLLDDKVPSDPEMAEFVKSCKEDVKKIQSQEKAKAELLKARAELEKKGGVYLGVEVCARCHSEEFEQWNDTPHAKALSAIREKGELTNPECLKCHTTGYGGAGGYISYDAKPDLGNVQCEMCHGIGRDHARDGSYGKVTEKTCVGCHDEKNSPDFDYSSYLSKVVHRR